MMVLKIKQVLQMLHRNCVVLHYFFRIMVNHTLMRYSHLHSVHRLYLLFICLCFVHSPKALCAGYNTNWKQFDDVTASWQRVTKFVYCWCDHYGRETNTSVCSVELYRSCWKRSCEAACPWSWNLIMLWWQLNWLNLHFSCLLRRCKVLIAVKNWHFIFLNNFTTPAKTVRGL